MIIRNAFALLVACLGAALLQAVLFAPVILLRQSQGGMLLLGAVFWHSALFLCLIGGLVLVPLYVWRGRSRGLARARATHLTVGAATGVVWAYLQLPLLLRALPRDFWGDAPGAAFGLGAQLALILGGGLITLAAATLGGEVFWRIAIKTRPPVDPFTPPPDPARVPAMWPGMLALALPLPLVLLAASVNIASIAAVTTLTLMMLFASIWAGVALFAASRSAFLGAWGAAASFAVLPLVWLLVLAPWAPLGGVTLAGDLVHFLNARASFDRQVAALPRSHDPAFAFFQWRGDEINFNGLVYDESDSAALPEESRPRDWYPLRRYPGLHCTALGFTPLWDHYYLAAFRWSAAEE